MGTEYWIVKPNKQETFYLGKHIEPLECIESRSYAASYINCDCFHDFLLDVIDTNDGFLDDSYPYAAIKEFAYVLYEWCDDKVYLSNDCCDDFKLWKGFKETGSIVDFCEKHNKEETNADI